MKNLKKYFIIFMAAVLLLTMRFANATNLESSDFNDLKQRVIDEYLNATSWRSDNIIEKDSVIVRFKDAVSQVDIDEFQYTNGLLDKIKLINDANLFTFKLPDNAEMSLKFLTKINESSSVLYAEPNYRCTLNEEPYFNVLWNLKNKTYPGIDVDVENAWKIVKGSPSVVVAIVDSGIDYNHKDLKDNIWVNTKEIPNNRIDDDKDGYVDDTNGWNFYGKNNKPMDDYNHGTHVSGTVAALENNYGVIGVAPNVKLMPLKIFGKDGGVSNFADIISAVVYAHDHGASIVNMSFGGKGNSQSLYDVMNKFKDMLFVSAAGNNGSNNDVSPFFPANYDLANNITVASIDQNGALSSYSNYGIKTVDVAAPGKSIYSTLPNNKFGYMSGTSMATPHVTGLCALIKSSNINLTPNQIKQIIMNNVRPLQTLKGKVQTGGLIDSSKALDAIKKIEPPVKVESIKDVFPDNILSQEIAKQLNKTVNDAFTEADSKKIVSIIIQNGVSSAKGIERLVNLTTLKLTHGNLTSIDLTRNVNLNVLELQYNEIASINLSPNVKLQRLILYSNAITKIDLTKNVNLTFMNLSYNQLTSLDLSKNIKGNQIYAENNKLNSINFGNANNFQIVFLANNNLKALDLVNQKLLIYYRVTNNPFIANGLKLPSQKLIKYE